MSWLFFDYYLFRTKWIGEFNLFNFVGDRIGEKKKMNKKFIYSIFFMFVVFVPNEEANDLLENQKIFHFSPSHHSQKPTSFLRHLHV